MTTHDDSQYEGHDLLARLTDAAGTVDVAPGDVEAVRSRARQRDVRRRGAIGMASVVAAVAVIGVGVSLLDDPRPPAIMSGTESDAPVDPGPTEGSGPKVDTIDAGEFGYDHSRFGAFGVERHHGGAVEVLSDEAVEAAIGLEDGTVVAQQSVPGTDGEFGRLVLLASGEEPRVLVDTGRILRLLEARDGLAWFTTRTDPAEGAGETEERFQSVDLTTGEVVDRGTAAGHESGTDALALADDGTTVFLRCHLACTTWVGDLASMVELDSARDGFSAGNIVGAAITRDGDHIATVRVNVPIGTDPRNPPADFAVGADGLMQLVVTEVATRTEIRVQLPIDVIPQVVEFTPDGRDVLASGSDGAVLVEDVFEEPRVAVLSGVGGITVHGMPEEGQAGADLAWAGPADEYDSVVWPVPGSDALDWTVTAGAPDASDWRTDPVEVVARFLGAVAPDQLGPGPDAPAVSVAQIVEEPDGAAGFIDVSSTAEIGEHMVTVRRIAESPYWWVVGADVADGAVADLSLNGHLWASYAAQGRDRRVDGHVPPGVTIDIVPFGDTPKGALRVDQDAWQWTADAEPGAPVGIAMVARDAEGRVVHVSVLAFGAQDVVAG